MIHKNICYLLILFLCIACTNDKKVTPTNFDEYYTLMTHHTDAEIKIVDTACINAKQRATIDAENKKFTYYDFVGLGMRNRSYDEEAKLLEKFNIKSEETFVSCIRHSDRFEDHCYEKKMNELVEDIYGTCFIDSIKLEAEKLFILKHPNRVYNYFESDYEKKYAAYIAMEKQYKATFNYPKDYQFKKGKAFSYTSASFVILKNGDISELQVTTEFQNEANNKYKKLFNNRLKSIVSNIKWKPTKIHGYTVNSELDVTIHYK